MSQCVINESKKSSSSGRCMEINPDGTRCCNEAVVHVDLLKRPEFLKNWKIPYPVLNCCRFCTTHLTILAAAVGLQLGVLLLKRSDPNLKESLTLVEKIGKQTQFVYPTLEIAQWQISIRLNI